MAGTKQKIPTIATQVPRGAFTWATRKIKEVVSIPVAASNRLNMPDDAERVLQNGDADMIAMARPFLADPRLGSENQRSPRE